MNEIEGQLHRAKALLEGGRSEEARLCLLELLQKEKDNTAALLILGGVYFAEQKYAEAEMVFQRLVRLEPDSGRLSIALFNTLWKQGRHEEAAGEIHRFLAVADRVKEAETLRQYAAISQAIASGDYEVAE